VGGGFSIAGIAEFHSHANSSQPSQPNLPKFGWGLHITFPEVIEPFKFSEIVYFSYFSPFYGPSCQDLFITYDVTAHDVIFGILVSSKMG